LVQVCEAVIRLSLFGLMTLTIINTVNSALCLSLLLTGLQKRYADDEDFQLTTAEEVLLAKQAAELQDPDPPLSKPHAATATPKQPPHTVNAVKDMAPTASLQHSASLPNADTVTNAAAAEAACKPPAPALLHSVSLPAASPAAASEATAAAATPSQLPAAQPARESAPAVAQHTQDLPSSSAAAVDAVDAPAMSDGGSQRSRSRIWRPPFALSPGTSPQRSSGTSSHQAACRPQALTPAKQALNALAKAADSDRASDQAGIQSPQRSGAGPTLMPGVDSPLKALADQVGERALTKKRKSADSPAPPPGSPKRNQGSGDRQASKTSKMASFVKSAIQLLGSDTKTKKNGGGDMGQGDKEKGSRKAGKGADLKAIAARQMEAALGKQLAKTKPSGKLTTDMVGKHRGNWFHTQLCAHHLMHTMNGHRHQDTKS